MRNFIDRVGIEIISGAGGNGCVSFRREKYVPRGGPDGGNGGDGGAVYLLGSRHLNTLLELRYRKRYKAERGKHGSGQRKTGHTGIDLDIPVPLGTIAVDDETSIIIGEVLEDGERIQVAEGGHGGRGNTAFTTSVNRAPRNAEEGKPGISMKLRLELKLIADVGIVGKPNAGKSTLLSRISAAKPKVAPYPFTTLTPSLGIVKYGDYGSFVITDIPGLVEGAHQGRGLGHRFLRHVERTRFLLLLIDLSSESVLEDIRLLRRELALHNPVLAEKEHVLAFNKCDAAEMTEDIRKDVLKEGLSRFFIISALRGDGLNELVGHLGSIVNADNRDDG